MKVIQNKFTDETLEALVREVAKHLDGFTVHVPTPNPNQTRRLSPTAALEKDGVSVRFQQGFYGGDRTEEDCLHIFFALPEFSYNSNLSHSNLKDKRVIVPTTDDPKRLAANVRRLWQEGIVKTVEFQREREATNRRVEHTDSQLKEISNLFEGISTVKVDTFKRGSGDYASVHIYFNVNADVEHDAPDIDITIDNEKESRMPLNVELSRDINPNHVMKLLRGMAQALKA